MSQHDDTDSRAVEQLAGTSTANESVHSLTRPSARSVQFGDRQARLRRPRNDELGAIVSYLRAEAAPREFIKVDRGTILPDTRNREAGRPVFKLDALGRTVKLKETVHHLKTCSRFCIAKEEPVALLASASPLGRPARGLPLVVDWVAITDFNKEPRNYQSFLGSAPGRTTNLEKLLGLGLSEFVPARSRSSEKQERESRPSQPGIFSPPGAVSGNSHLFSSAANTRTHSIAKASGGSR